MLLGRFIMMIPVLALAGSFVKKRIVPASGGRFPVSGFTFAVVLVGTVLILGALTFLPALALGPIVEHFLMMGSNRLY
jgi:K+-transporting ATPase ATPase A chain